MDEKQEETVSQSNDAKEEAAGDAASQPEAKADTADSTPNDPIPVPEATAATPSPATEQNAGTWWSGWYESAVHKSTQAMDFMRKDLSELSVTMQSESASLIDSSSSVLSSGLSVVSNTASYLKDAVSSLVEEEEEDEVEQVDEAGGQVDGEKKTVKEPLSPEELEERMRQKEAAFQQEVRNMLSLPESLATAASSKLTSVINSLVDVLSPIGYGSDGDDASDVVLLPDNQTMGRDRWDMLLRAIQSDPRTYCHEPDGAPEDFESWLERFNLMDIDVQSVLNSSPDVRNFHATLVPDQMTFDMFWHRYFYRIECLKVCEARRAKMLKERSVASKQAADRDKEDMQSTGTGRQEVQITNLKDSPVDSRTGTTAVTPTEGKTSSGATSDEWEKTSLTDIVDEAAAKLAHKLNAQPDTRSDEELNEWEFE